MALTGKPAAKSGKASKTAQPGKPELRSAPLALDPDWKYLAPLRETALTFLPGEIAPIAQSLASWVLESYVDDLEGVRAFRGSFSKMKLRAAMLDLRHTARWLAMAAESASDSDLRSDVELAGLVDELAMTVERLAGLIEEQISPRAAKRLRRRAV
jgi:hypothetical protein